MHGKRVWKEFPTCRSLNTMIRHGEIGQDLRDTRIYIITSSGKVASEFPESQTEGKVW